MNNEEIFKKFKEILSEHIDDENNETLTTIHEDTDLQNDLGIDSLDVVNIVIDIETCFNIRVENEEVQELKKVKDCIRVIQNKLEDNS